MLPPQKATSIREVIVIFWVTDRMFPEMSDMLRGRIPLAKEMV